MTSCRKNLSKDCYKIEIPTNFSEIMSNIKKFSDNLSDKYRDCKFGIITDCDNIKILKCTERLKLILQYLCYIPSYHPASIISSMVKYVGTSFQFGEIKENKICDNCKSELKAGYGYINNRNIFICIECVVKNVNIKTSKISEPDLYGHNCTLEKILFQYSFYIKDYTNNLLDMNIHTPVEDAGCSQCSRRHDKESIICWKTDKNIYYCLNCVILKNQGEQTSKSGFSRSSRKKSKRSCRKKSKRSCRKKSKRSCRKKCRRSCRKKSRRSCRK